MLVRAIEDGASIVTREQETFAYASAFDETSGRYLGLVAGQHASVLIDAESVVVKSEVARKQLDEERPPAPSGDAPEAPPAGAGGADEAEAPGEHPGEPTLAPADAKPRRFYGAIVGDPVRMSRDAGQVADEAVKHLAGLVDTHVEVRIEIAASSEDGFPDDVVRTVTENARTLKFEQHGFEQEWSFRRGVFRGMIRCDECALAP